MLVIPFVDSPLQTLSMVLNSRRCTMTFRWNRIIDRWSIDLDVDSVPALTGKRLVPYADVLGPFDLDLGGLYVGDYAGTGEGATYDAMVSGRLRLYYLTPVEQAGVPA